MAQTKVCFSRTAVDIFTDKLLQQLQKKNPLPSANLVGPESFSVFHNIRIFV